MTRAVVFLYFIAGFVLVPLAAAAPEEFAFEQVPWSEESALEIQPGKLWIYSTVLREEPLKLKRGTELSLDGLIANTTGEDLILFWGKPPPSTQGPKLEVTSWNIPSAFPIVSGQRAIGVWGPPPEYRILFSTERPHMDSGNILRLPVNKVRVPDVTGSGTLEVSLEISGFVGGTKRPAIFTFNRTLRVIITE
jgi:hypothetical protein